MPLRGSDARDFVALWEEAFGPFRDWLSRAALCVAAEVERDYRASRLTKGALTYADQVELALELFHNPKPRGAFANTTTASFSTKRRIPARRSSATCSKARDQPKRRGAVA